MTPTADTLRDIATFHRNRSRDPLALSVFAAQHRAWAELLGRLADEHDAKAAASAAGDRAAAERGEG